MRETWYVMEDGSAGDPRAIAPGKDGRLVHKDGRKVAYAPHGPRSRSIDVPPKPFGGKGDHDGDGRTGGSVPALKRGEISPNEARGDQLKITGDMKAEDPPAEKPKRGYKTRGSKAD